MAITQVFSPEAVSVLGEAFRETGNKELAAGALPSRQFPGLFMQLVN